MTNKGNILIVDDTPVNLHLLTNMLAEQLQESNEALRQQAAELAARNEELDAFAGTVAHDLRGPMTPIINALKYGGRPPQVELGVNPYNGQIRFWVSDNGQGISAAEQQRLFAPFVRLNEGTVEGHGLGLSIVKRIVHKLGGEVGVVSTPNEGSCFWFTLPAAEKD